MVTLNFKPQKFIFKKANDKNYIYDSIRRKFVWCSPEEWVRQHIVKFLITEKRYPTKHINIEKEFSLNGLKRRYDIVVFNRNGDIIVVVECKSPHVIINRSVFDQVFKYNSLLNAQYLMVSNGLLHFYCKIDANKNNCIFIKDLPQYESD